MTNIPLILLFAGPLFLLFFIWFDLFFYFRADKLRREGKISYPEWFAVPNRTRIGSGFRLWAKFRDRA